MKAEFIAGVVLDNKTVQAQESIYKGIICKQRKVMKQGILYAC